MLIYPPEAPSTQQFEILQPPHSYSSIRWQNAAPRNFLPFHLIKNHIPKQSMPNNQREKRSKINYYTFCLQSVVLNIWILNESHCQIEISSYLLKKAVKQTLLLKSLGRWCKHEWTSLCQHLSSIKLWFSSSFFLFLINNFQQLWMTSRKRTVELEKFLLFTRKKNPRCYTFSHRLITLYIYFPRIALRCVSCHLNWTCENYCFQSIKSTSVKVFSI